MALWCELESNKWRHSFESKWAFKSEHECIKNCSLWRNEYEPMLIISTLSGNLLMFGVIRKWSSSHVLKSQFILTKMFYWKTMFHCQAILVHRSKNDDKNHRNNWQHLLSVYCVPGTLFKYFAHINLVLKMTLNNCLHFIEKEMEQWTFILEIPELYSCGNLLSENVGFLPQN